MTDGGNYSAFRDEIMTAERSRVFQFDDVRVETETFKVFKAGSPAELEPKALRVLLYLIEHRGRLVEKSELLDAVWKDTNVTENAMTREIAKLRKLLGDSSREPKYIQTVHTRGYRFIAEVEEINGAPSNGQSVAVAEPPAAYGSANGNGHNGAPANATPLVIDAAPLAVSAPAKPNGKVTRRRKLRKILWYAGVIGLSSIMVFIFVMSVGWKFGLVGLIPPANTGGRNLVRVTSWPGLDVNPTLAPDGNSVAYSSDHGGSFEIYVRQLVPGGREVQITADGAQNFDPAWSPDGKFIAYHSLKRGGIWISPALGGVARQLTDFGAHPAWSRDGVWLAFHSEPAPDIGAVPVNTATLWVVAAQGSAPRQLTQVGNPVGSHLSPTWAADGKRVAFISANARATQIWSVAVTGGDLKQLTPVGTGDKSDPVFGAAGTSLYFTLRGVLWRRGVAADGTLTADPPAKIADMGDAYIRHLSVSADGRRVTYSAWTQTSNIWSLTLNAEAAPKGAPVRLTNETGTRNMQPVFAPDGRSFAYINWRRGGAQQVWTADSDGGHTAQLTTSPPSKNWPRWLPGGERLAFETNLQGKRALVVLTLANGREETLTELGGTIESPQLAPDARRLAYNIREDGAVNIATMDLSNGQVRPLTSDHEMIGHPCWSPDGRWLAAQMRRGNDTHISVMPADGGPPVQLTFEHGQSWPYGWSPDGARIIFAGERAGIWNLYWVARDGRTKGRLTNYDKLNAYVRYPAWSPLGTQIAYEYAETTGNIYVMDLP